MSGQEWSIALRLRVAMVQRLPRLRNPVAANHRTGDSRDGFLLLWTGWLRCPV